MVTLPACGRRTGLSPTREQAYRANNRGVAELEQFNYEAAVTAFRDALQRDSALTIARVNLALALFYAGDLEAATREATAAARLLPRAPQPPYLLGLIARADNRAADAIRFFERVRTLDDGDAGARVQLAQVYVAERRYGEAIALLRPAAVEEPYNLTVAYSLGLALTRDGQRDEGQRFLDRAESLRSTAYAVSYGSGYLEQGHYAEAIASTGAEPDLVDAALPASVFVRSAIGGTVVPQAASPFGRRFLINELPPGRANPITAGLAGCVTLIDVDGDHDLDVFDARDAQHLFRNDGHGTWTDVTSAFGLNAPVDGVPIGCLAADYDNDGRSDLFVLRDGVSSLYHNEGTRFADVTAAAGIVPYPYLPGAAAFVDVDHDGDVDLVIAGLADLAASRRGAGNRAALFPDEFAPAPMRLLRNNGNGTFTDTTLSAHLDIATHAVALAPADYDGRRDVDLLVVNRGAPPLLLQNRRDGTFRDVASATGLIQTLPAFDLTSVTVTDVNKDGFPDLFFGRAAGGAFALSDGRGHFTAAPAPPGARAGIAAQFLDYDSDGLPDLLMWSDAGPMIFRNRGDRWSDVSARALPGAAGQSLTSARNLLLADIDGDGRTDLVTGGSALSVWHDMARDGHASLRVELTGRTSNRSGIGAVIEVRAGSLKTRLERSAATPPIAPADIVAGLGGRDGADVVRVLWPSGVLQAETASTVLPARLAIEELNRKPSSCPFLFAWNGERFEFVTDFLGGGELGYWEGPGRRNTPDPLEYVRIRGDQLRPRDGRFELRVTNELEEALFADRMTLVTIAHPAGTAVYPDEGMTAPAKAHRLFAVGGNRVPTATDDRGIDVTALIARRDRQSPDGFALERFRGFAATHALTLDLAPLDAAPILLLTGWTDYAFSSDNLAAYQAGLSLQPPSLQVEARDGTWRTVISDIGIPVGRPQTVTVDLAGRLRAGEHRVRIVTNMRIYWDQIEVAAPQPLAALRIERRDPASATLRHRGFSSEVRPDGRDPIGYDYARTVLTSPWKTLTGFYTREGDVRRLLTASDDMFAILKPGDEIAISFDATALPPLPTGWTRTYLLAADGFSKEMDINSASPDRLEPLPFHAMSGYPYPASERYPNAPAWQEYRAAYNTRAVVKPVLPLDAAAR